MHEKLGLTGEFPKGKLNDTDEGALRVAVGPLDDARPGSVVIILGSQVAWIGFDQDESLIFARAVLKHAFAHQPGVKSITVKFTDDGDAPITINPQV